MSKRGSGGSKKLSLEWIALIAGLVGAVSGLSSLAYDVWTQQKLSQENATLVLRRVLDDYPTELKRVAGQREAPAGGIIFVYWDALVSNNGGTPIAITDYEVSELTSSGAKEFSRFMDQGIYSVDLSPLRLPLIVNPGHAARIYLRTGLRLHQEAYGLVSRRFSHGQIKSVRQVIEFLYANGTDFYGNQVHSPYPGVAFVNPEGRKEQIFIVRLITARDAQLQGLVSWYTYAGIAQ